MYPRYVRPRIEEALNDTRVVVIIGPRQSGKTTLARQLAGAERTFLTLDNASTLAAATNDPVGFIRDLDKAVVDEVQRAPELILAIKESVDIDQRPGRFLLTGSADLLALPRVADSLAGRMETVPLLPLATAEIERTKTSFLADLFAGRPRISKSCTGTALVDRVLAGGYPEALRRSSWTRRHAWFRGYLEAIVKRDVTDLANIAHLVEMPRLLATLAHQAGQLTNFSAAGSAIGLSHVTAARYTRILEELFLVRILPAWHHNRLKRLVKTPKLHFTDSGLLAALCDLTPEQVADDRTPFGAILETFVVGEVMKQASWSEPIHLFHYRDKEGDEVDLILLNGKGQLAGIEVKASATVRAADFNGLRKFAAAARQQFRAGVVLYDGDRVIPFGAKLFATPFGALW
jgi:uncharacterized protein